MIFSAFSLWLLISLRKFVYFKVLVIGLPSNFIEWLGLWLAINFSRDWRLGLWLAIRFCRMTWTWLGLAIRFCRMTWTWLGLAITTWWLGNDLPSIFHATWRLGLWLAINFSRDLTTWTVTCHQLFIINQIHSLIRIYASLFDIRLSFSA